MNARPYQRNCIEAVDAGWCDFKKQIIGVPTGGGKTVIFSHLAAANPGRTLILAHREELIDQAVAKLRAATGIEAEKDKAEHIAERDARVVVASVQTLMRENRLNRWSSDHFDLVVCDEAHHAISPSWRGVLSRFDERANVLGVTATLDRGDKKNLGVYFENIPYEITMFGMPNEFPNSDDRHHGLVKLGYLAPIVTRTVPLGINVSAVRSTAGDLNAGDLGSVLDPYLDRIADALKEFASDRRTLVFLPLIATSQKFTEACRKAGLNAEHIDGTSEDRRDKLNRFAAWDFNVLCNAMLLTEGFDDPSIDCVVVLRPTRSRPLYAQMVGRGTRVDPLKENLLLLDFLWMHEKHSISRPAHLIAGSEDEADIITKIAADAAGGGGDDEQELQALSVSAVAQREEALRKRLEEQKSKKGTLISAEEFAMRHGSLAIAEFEPVMAWEQKPITDSQARYLKRQKIDPDSVRGRGHAAKVIDLAYRNQKLEMATGPQRAYMRRRGFPGWKNATKADAARFFSTVHQKKQEEFC